MRYFFGAIMITFYVWVFGHVIDGSAQSSKQKKRVDTLVIGKTYKECADVFDPSQVKILGIKKDQVNCLFIEKWGTWRWTYPKSWVLMWINACD